MDSLKPIPVLILAYNKPARLAGLITSLLRFGFSHFWISIDGPRDSATSLEQDKINQFLEDLSCCPRLSLTIRKLERNLGGPVAVPQGITWFFSEIQDSIGLVMEEDLQLIRDPKPLIRCFNNLGDDNVVGGTLFTAGEFPSCQIAPLFEPWGWFMNGFTWRRLQHIEPDRVKLESILSKIGSRSCRHFWLGIYDRIYRSGGSCTPLHWDYDVYIKMLQENLCFLHPPSKLCVNHGYGSKAQNTVSLPSYALSFRRTSSLSLRSVNSIPLSAIISQISHRRHYYSSTMPSKLHNLFSVATGKLRLTPWINLLRNKKNSLQSLLRAQQSNIDRYRGQDLLERPGLAVNIGAGSIRLPGFICVDARDLVGQDIVQFSPYLCAKPNSLAEIYCSHVLEHFPSAQIPSILANFYRVISPGGLLRIAVPDFSWFASEYTKGVGLNELLPSLFGGQNYDFNYHMGAFDRSTLTELLLRAGFSRVETWSSEEFFLRLGCEPDFSAHPCSLNLLAFK